jgi:hypothetical protein
MQAADNTPGAPGVYVDPVTVGPPSLRPRTGRSVASAGDIAIYLKYAPTGAAATTGQGVFVLEFEGGFPG